MADGYPGDATEEDIKKLVIANLRGQLAGLTTERQVSIDPATAAMLLELLPEDEDNKDK